MATINPSFKILGPFSPKEWMDPTTLATAIDTAAGSLTGTSTTSLIASDPVCVLGNWYVLLTWV